MLARGNDTLAHGDDRGGYDEDEADEYEKQEETTGSFIFFL